MGSKGILKEIEKALINGESKDNLNKRYNKAAVTRVYNRLHKDYSINNDELSQVDEKEIEKLLKKILYLINNKGEYEITIAVNKKVDNISNNSGDNNGDILNPFKLYDELSRDIMVNELKEKERNYLIKIIKKYFNYNSKLLKGHTNEELAVHICSEVEKILNIGNCFK